MRLARFRLPVVCITANNKCLVVLGVNAAAVAADSGGTSQGSTNPNANYTY